MADQLGGIGVHVLNLYEGLGSISLHVLELHKCLGGIGVHVLQQGYGGGGTISCTRTFPVPLPETSTFWQSQSGKRKFPI